MANKQQREFLMHLFDKEEQYTKVMDLLDHSGKWSLLDFSSVTKLRKTFGVIDTDEAFIFNSVARHWKLKKGQDCPLSFEQYKEISNDNKPDRISSFCLYNNRKLEKLVKNIEKEAKRQAVVASPSDDMKEPKIEEKLVLM